MDVRTCLPEMGLLEFPEANGTIFRTVVRYLRPFHPHPLPLPPLRPIPEDHAIVYVHVLLTDESQTITFLFSESFS